MRFGSWAGGLFIGVGIVLSACGGGDASTTAPSTAPTSQTPATTEAPSTTPAPPTTSGPSTTTSTVPPLPTLTLTVDGFPSLEGGFHYEGWAVIGGSAVSTGKFNVTDDERVVDLDGNPIEALAVDADLAAATAIVITIEPAGDADTVAADTHLVAGDVTNGGADLTMAHPAGLGTDFAEAAGRFVLATPSTDTKADELSGIWFLTLPGPEPGLELPELPPGWKYEGWAVVDEVPLTTGKFIDVASADEAAPFGGPGRMPDFPGEDFVANAPVGVTLPTDLSGTTIVVSVEPDPDDDPAPFILQPLVGQIPDPSQPEPVAYDLVLNIDAVPFARATIG